MSFGVHAVILIAAASTGLRGCTGTGQRGEAETGLRTIGIITQTDDATSGGTESGEADAPGTEATEVAVTPAVSTTSAALSSANLSQPDEPPVDLPDVPGGDLPRALGDSSAVPRFGPAGSGGSPEMSAGGPVASGPAASAGGGGPAGLARGETSFLGIRDKGQSFAYVIDASGSMGSHDALAVAKAELMASLEALDVEQSFQVIFYNEQPHPIRLPGTRPAAFYTASNINRTLARREIAAVQADMGTRHLPALQAALSTKPDVIFLLSDAGDLSAPDIEAIRRANAGRTRIHCVEFGRGPKLGRESPLERLAEANGGVYQYRDVERFRR